MSTPNTTNTTDESSTFARLFKSGEFDAQSEIRKWVVDELCKPNKIDDITIDVDHISDADACDVHEIHPSKIAGLK